MRWELSAAQLETLDTAMHHERLLIAHSRLALVDEMLRPFVEVAASYLTEPRQPDGHIILRNHHDADAARGVSQEQVEHACAILPYTPPTSRIKYGPDFHRHMGTTRSSAVTTAVEEAAQLVEVIGLTSIDELQARAAELEDALRPFLVCAQTHIEHGQEDASGTLWVSASGSKPRSAVTWQFARRAVSALPELLAAHDDAPTKECVS